MQLFEWYTHSARGCMLVGWMHSWATFNEKLGTCFFMFSEFVGALDCYLRVYAWFCNTQCISESVSQ